jgi:hypothetical protein
MPDAGLNDDGVVPVVAHSDDRVGRSWSGRRGSGSETTRVGGRGRAQKARNWTDKPPVAGRPVSPILAIKFGPCSPSHPRAEVQRAIPCLLAGKHTRIRRVSPTRLPDERRRRGPARPCRRASEVDRRDDCVPIGTDTDVLVRRHRAADVKLRGLTGRRCRREDLRAGPQTAVPERAGRARSRAGRLEELVAERRCWPCFMFRCARPRWR